MSGDELRRRRLALGLSRRALAERTALTIAAIDHLEQHGDHPQRSAAHRVRDALGLPQPSNPVRTREPTADDVAIEALIADHAASCRPEDIADALDWTLPRVINSIEALRRRLEQTGQALIRDSGNRYALAARTSLLDDQTRRRTHETHLSDLDPVTASILHQILDGPREDRLWTNFATLEQLEAIRHLLGAELIYDDGATLRPTGRTLATFGINGEFNTPRGPRVELERDRRAADIT